MKPSEIIEEQIKAEILEGAKIADPKEFARWLRRNNFTVGAVSAITGADKTATMDKLKAGERATIKADEYLRMSKPLTSENYEGTPETWDIGRPRDLIINRLAEALDKSADIVSAVRGLDIVERMYLVLLERDGNDDPTGLAHNRRMMGEQGMRPSELMFGFEESPEFQRLHADKITWAD